MVCYRENSDGAFSTERDLDLDEMIRTSIREATNQAYQVQMEKRLQREQEAVRSVLASLAPQPTKVSSSVVSPLPVNNSVLEAQEQARELQNRVAEAKREYEKAQRGLRLREERAAREQEESEKMEQELLELRNGLEQRRGEMDRRQRQLDAKEQETARLKRNLEIQRAEQADRAAKLSTKERQLDERQRRADEEQRRLYQEAAGAVAALKAGFEAAHGEIMRRWQETAYQEAYKAVAVAVTALRAGSLPKVHLVVEQAKAQLEQLEKQTAQDQRLEEERKKKAGILIAALCQVGYEQPGVKVREPGDPRSPVDIMAKMPSGKGIWFVVRHDGVAEIRQSGVAGHDECHSVEDAIKAATARMGLTFGRGHLATARREEPLAPGVPIKAHRHKATAK